jgi:hypothetical protein
MPKARRSISLFGKSLAIAAKNIRDENKYDAFEAAINATRAIPFDGIIAAVGGFFVTIDQLGRF